MGEPSMEPGGELRNTAMREMRSEAVTKDDGRYLIYYSWPDEGDDDEGAARGVQPTGQRPAQQPWSPETGASDV